MTTTKVPALLRNSEAYYDDPDGATELWDKGFRPVQANLIRRGMEVAYVETMFGFNTSKHGVTRVEEVTEADDYGTIRVSTDSRGVVEVDDCSEVWVRG